jgi:hypothetical protein
MKRFFFAIAVTGLIGLPSIASAQNGQITGFGGLTFGDVTQNSTFGGTVAVPLADNLQAIVEGGRMNNVLPPLVDTLVGLTPVNLALSAWYGEGGVRFIGSPHQTIRPYAEATAGFARLSIGVSGIGSTAGAITNTALNLFNRTDPLLGVGGGVIVQGGPILLDAGYRYKKILAGRSLEGALTGGDFSVSEIRLGVGLRF